MSGFHSIFQTTTSSWPCIEEGSLESDSAVAGRSFELVDAQCRDVSTHQAGLTTSDTSISLHVHYHIRMTCLESISRPCPRGESSRQHQ
jgi:hypothetical protein